MEQPELPQEPSKEESIFDTEDFSMKGYDKHIRNARIILFVIAAFQLVGIFLSLKLSGPVMWISIGGYTVIALVFSALALWTKQKPFTALLIGLILYIALLVGDAIVDPSDIIKGILLKILVIILLILGLKNGKQAQDLRDAFGEKD